MKAVITTTFNTDFKTAVENIQKPALLEFITWPILSFTYLDPKRKPKKWSSRKYLTVLTGFGFLPLGNQFVNITIPEQSSTKFVIRDNGSGTLVKKWDHLITIQKTSQNHVSYTDEVIVEAGLLTIPIWCFAQFFYRWRQVRWKLLIARGFEQIS
jgi:hypothetical protein